VLWIAGINIGLSYKEAFWHSIWLFMGSSVNSGFAPQSISLLYYHSCVIEIITVVIFIIGAFNFSFHYALCTGNRKEIYKNIEVIVFIISISILSYIVFSGLEHQGIYSDVVSFIRKGLYILASAHTTTGHMTIYPSHFVSEWGAFAMLGIIIAMAIGGCTGSTAGGIKVLRIGLISKGMYQYIRKLAFPSSAVIKGKFHHIKELVLDDTVIYSAMLIVLCYILTYCLGAVIGVYYGYPFLQALFESVSATSTCGLSCGVVSPDMPIIMKIVFILQMWLGRLEFISIFVLIGFILSGTKKLRFKG
jgi:trk system potassium uptake protein TrkH